MYQNDVSISLSRKPTPYIFYRDGRAYARISVKHSFMKDFSNKRFIVKSLGFVDRKTAKMLAQVFIYELWREFGMKNWEDLGFSQIKMTAGGISVDTDKNPNDLDTLRQLGLLEPFLKRLRDDLENKAPVQTIKSKSHLTLGKAIDTYINEKFKSVKTQRQRQEITFTLQKMLPAIVGDTSNMDIEDIDNIEFKNQIVDFLALTPKNPTKSPLTSGYFRDESNNNGWLLMVQDIRSGKLTGYDVISDRTKDKYIDTFKAFWRWASSMYKDFPPNPFITTKSIANSPYGKVNKKRGFTDDELILLLDKMDFSHSWQKWLFVLGLYTGARINEICQLTPDDIIEYDEFYMIRLSTDDGKQLKNQASNRTIPVHPDLINFGFISYISKISKGNRLISVTVNGNYSHGKNASAWFNRAMKSLLNTPELSFHSFRHTFTTKLFYQGVERKTISDMTGHTIDKSDHSVMVRNYVDASSASYLFDALNDNLKFSDEIRSRLAKLLK